MQVVQAAIKTVTLCHKAYRDGRTNQELDDAATEFTAAFQELNLKDNARPNPTHTGNAIPNPTEKALLDLGGKVNDAAKRLHDELRRFDVADPSTLGAKRKLQATTAAIKAMWSTKLEGLQKEFEIYQQVLQTRLLIDIRQRIDLLTVKQAEAFDHADARLQQFVLQLLASQTAGHQSSKDHLDIRITRLAVDTDNAARRKEFLDSLRYPDMLTRQETMRAAYANTFEWLFEERTQAPGQVLSRWLETGNGIFWLEGKAGSGKSTLMNFIFEDHRTMKLLKSSIAPLPVMRIGHFFWSPGQAMQKSLSGMLRSLLWQLCDSQHGIMDLLVALHDASVWTERRLASTTREALQHMSKTASVCIFIDGLDEYDGEADNLLDLIDTLHNTTNIKILVSSRPWAVYEARYQGCPNLRLQDVNADDIRLFVNKKLKFAEASGLEVRQLFKLTQRITNLAQGVFLWVTLTVASVVDGLHNEDSYDQLLQRISDMPREVDALYGAMLESIHPSYRARTARYFRLLLNPVDHLWNYIGLTILDFALVDLERLQQGERKYAQTVQDRTLKGTYDRANRHVLKCCGGLLEIHNRRIIYGPQIPMALLPFDQATAQQNLDNLKVDFLHRTAYDYLRSHPETIASMTHASDTMWNPAVAQAEVLVERICFCNPNQHLLMNIEHALTTAKDAITWLDDAAADMRRKLLDRLHTNADEIWARVTEEQPPFVHHWACLLSRPSTSKVLKIDYPDKYSEDCLVRGPPNDYLGFCAFIGQVTLFENELAQITDTYRTYLFQCLIDGILAAFSNLMLPAFTARDLGLRTRYYHSIGRLLTPAVDVNAIHPQPELRVDYEKDLSDNARVNNGTLKICEVADRSSFTTWHCFLRGIYLHDPNFILRIVQNGNIPSDKTLIDIANILVSHGADMTAPLVISDCSLRIDIDRQLEEPISLKLKLDFELNVGFWLDLLHEILSEDPQDLPTTGAIEGQSVVKFKRVTVDCEQSEHEGGQGADIAFNIAGAKCEHISEAEMFEFHLERDVSDGRVDRFQDMLMQLSVLYPARHAKGLPIPLLEPKLLKEFFSAINLPILSVSGPISKVELSGLADVADKRRVVICEINDEIVGQDMLEYSDDCSDDFSPDDADDAESPMSDTADD